MDARKFIGVGVAGLLLFFCSACPEEEEDSESLDLPAYTDPLPENDECAGATTVTIEAGLVNDDFTYNTSRATTSRPGTGIFRDVWYAWTAPETATATISLCDRRPAVRNSSENTILAVYEGCPSAEQAPLARDDDSCGVYSRVTFPVTAGVRYLIQVGVPLDNDELTWAGGALISYEVPGDPDTDGDGLPDSRDNCPMTANRNQYDQDHDGIGNVCDDDRDGDGVLNEDDNCPTTSNPGQEDLDGDGIGDRCDNDGDGDGVANHRDNCARIPNPGQEDADGDGIGDVCEGDEGDADGDGVANGIDNCPTVFNELQRDSDGDGLGDVCDPDDDNDGLSDVDDNCDQAVNPDQLNTDGDSFGDACDPDDDNDGVLDADDNCPLVANADQADADGDGLGDVCDPDDDNDGVLDADDNCPRTANGDQLDSDGDGVGDACDTAEPVDTDSDGVADDIDNCVATPNPGQEDTDGDGVGDACDGCPADPNKTAPGACGCGSPDTDANSNGTPDCLEATAVTLTVHVARLGEPQAGGGVFVYDPMPGFDCVESPQLCTGTTDASGNFVCSMPLPAGSEICLYAYCCGGFPSELRTGVTVVDQGGGMMTLLIDLPGP